MRDEVVLWKQCILERKANGGTDIFNESKDRVGNLFRRLTVDTVE